MLKTLGFAALAAIAMPVAAAQQYRITDLGILSGANSSTARAISGNGAIAGESGSGQGANTGVRLDGGIVALPTLPGGTNFVTRGINDAGVVAATIQTAGGNDRAALATVSSITQLGGLAGYAAAGAFDVNNSGVAVGYALAGGALPGLEGSTPLAANALAQTALIWNGGTVTALAGPTGAVNTVAVSINDAGDVAGMFRTANNGVRAVKWSGGVATELTVAGQTTARTRAISEAGWVAGQTVGSLGSLGTVWAPSATYLLPLLGSATIGNSVTTTRGINSDGSVVGFIETFDDLGDSLGFTSVLWTYDGSGYVASDLGAAIVNAAGWDFTLTGAPQAINDNGDIVGFAFSPDGFQHGYLLTAVPEPATWSLLITGFGLVGAALRRRAVPA